MLELVMNAWEEAVHTFEQEKLLKFDLNLNGKTRAQFGWQYFEKTQRAEVQRPVAVLVQSDSVKEGVFLYKN